MEVKAPDPLMVELFRRVPAPGSVWPIDERARWLITVEATLNLLYGPVDKIEILPVFVRGNLDREMVERLRAHPGAIEPLLAEDPPEPPEVPAPPQSAEPVVPTDVAAEPEERTSDAAAVSQCTCEAGRMEGLSHHPECPKYEPLLPPLKNVGGRQSAFRPDNIPANLAMAIEAITELGPASAPPIRNWIRKKYWSNMPDHWTANLYDFVSSGKLARDGLNFIIPEKKPSAIAKEQTQVLPKEPSRAPMPRVQPTAGPRETVNPGAKLGPPARGGPMAFQHKGQTALLHHREFAIAQVLRAAMGRGHVDTQFLAQKALGSDKRNAIDNESLLRDLVTIMNPKLAPIGLTIEFHKGFGFVMKELA